MTEEYIQQKYRKIVSNIATIEDLDKFDGRQIRKLTNDFEEAIIRKIIVNVSSSTKNPLGYGAMEVQKQALNIIQNAWREAHYVGYDFGEEQYDSDFPEYFEFYQLLFASGELITLSTSEEKTFEEEPLPENNPALWEQAADKIGNVLGNKSSELLDALSQIEAITSDSMKHIDSLRDGTIKRLQEELKASEERNHALKAECNRLKSSEDAWDNLRQNIISECYDPLEIKEAGVPTDREILADIVEQLMNSRESDKKQKERERQLEAENERLKSEQDQWRERPEYKEEIQRYKNQKKESVKNDNIKKGLKKLALQFRDVQEYTNFIYRVNAMLQGTPWDSVSPTIVEEMQNYYYQEQIRKEQLSRAPLVNATEKAGEAMKNVAERPQTLQITENLAPITIENQTNYDSVLPPSANHLIE